MNFYNIAGPNEFLSFPASPKEQLTTRIVFQHSKKEGLLERKTSFEKKINKTAYAQPLKCEMISRPPSYPTSRCIERKMSDRSISSQMYIKIFVNGFIENK